MLTLSEQNIVAITLLTTTFFGAIHANNTNKLIKVTTNNRLKNNAKQIKTNKIMTSHLLCILSYGIMIVQNDMRIRVDRLFFLNFNGSEIVFSNIKNFKF